MYIKISPPNKDTIASGGSSTGLVKYLEKEKDLGIADDPWFNAKGEGYSGDEVISKIDGNALNKGAEAKEAKFFQVYVNPSKEELKHIKDDPAKLKDYTKLLMEQYAESFGRGIKESDLTWYAKLEHNRYYSGDSDVVRHNERFNAIQKDLKKAIRDKDSIRISELSRSVDDLKGFYVQTANGEERLVNKMNSGEEFIKRGIKKQGGHNMHVHIVVSRYHNTERLSFSPMANSRAHVQTIAEDNKNAQVVKIGFDRSDFALKGEQIFDLKFEYQRQLKNSVKEKLQYVRNSTESGLLQGYIGHDHRYSVTAAEERKSTFNKEYKEARYEMELIKRDVDKARESFTAAQGKYSEERQLLSVSYEEMNTLKQEYAVKKEDVVKLKTSMGEAIEKYKDYKQQLSDLKSIKGYSKNDVAVILQKIKELRLPELKESLAAARIDQSLAFENYQNAANGYKNNKEAFDIAKQAFVEAKGNYNLSRIPYTQSYKVFEEKRTAYRIANRDLQAKLFATQRFDNGVMSVMLKGFEKANASMGIHQLSYVLRQSASDGDVKKALENVLKNYNLEKILTNKVEAVMNLSTTLENVAAVTPQQFIVKAAGFVINQASKAIMAI